MRTYGRVYASDGTYTWVEVDSDTNGYDDAVWLTTLLQCLELQPNESPFFANYGIPSQQSVIQQIFPDYDVNKTQGQFAQYFAALQIAKSSSNTEPTYPVSVTPNQGAIIPNPVPR